MAEELLIVKTFELNTEQGLERFYSNPFLIAAFTKNPNGATYRQDQLKVYALVSLKSHHYLVLS